MGSSSDLITIVVVNLLPCLEADISHEWFCPSAYPTPPLPPRTTVTVNGCSSLVGLGLKSQQSGVLVLKPAVLVGHGLLSRTVLTKSKNNSINSWFMVITPCVVQDLDRQKPADRWEKARSQGEKMESPPIGGTEIMSSIILFITCSENVCARSCIYSHVQLEQDSSRKSAIYVIRTRYRPIRTHFLVQEAKHI